jgi:glucose-1-phosphate thymidylyltransferase
MLAGIRDILILSTPDHLPLFQTLLQDGRQWGLNLSYLAQPKPEGLAQAFILGREFIDGQPVCLVLGDNILYGHGLVDLLQRAAQLQKGALVFGYRVQDPHRYGVIEFDPQGQVLSFEEKPKKPKSNYAVPGLYFYDAQVCDLAATLQPSDRGELEITDLNSQYLSQGKLRVEILGRGYAWLDTGTHEALHQASSFIQTLEDRQGLKVACLEEIAYQEGYITLQQLTALAQPLAKSTYGTYLLNLINEALAPSP